jgi:signal transduction histidine kinase
VRYNVKVWDKNKNEITIDFNLKPMKDGSDKAKRLIAEGRLIQDLVDAQQALDEMIGKVTRQNETLKNFAHIVSHNMRSHASNISLLTDILNESKTENPSAQTIEMLREASHQLTETLGHVSDVVVIHTSEEENYCEINLYDAAERSLASISALISLADADVKLDIPEDLRVHGIPAYVDSIFLNLLSNSVKYKSIDRKLEISVKASKDKSMIKVSFTDNGMGIDLEKYGSKLFRMYKTFHGNEDARGIGLFLTKNQVESMGGQIEVDSVVGKQTTFDIYLPIV